MDAPVLPAPVPAFDAPFAPPEAEVLAAMRPAVARAPDAEARIDGCAADLIAAIRRQSGGIGGVEALLREYALTTKEGLALMILAESLLRVPDGATADRLIEDKLGQPGFVAHATRSKDMVVSAAAWALGVSARVIQAGETPEGTLAALTRRIGMPAVRAAARQAMRVMGGHFVLGETIAGALRRAGADPGTRYSFDMLGEGARTAADAARYADAYARAIAAIGAAAGSRPLPERPGISVKLSALHPRYEALGAARVMAELVPVLRDLARAARAHDLNFTIDAEEADRLELSLDLFDAVLADPALAGWGGYGLAVQAYQKRAGAVIDHVAACARRRGRTLMVRLVKGAYWDTEVKRAQERGLADYPVFTRKAATDLAYLAAARRLLALRPTIFPQFATHNALTVATLCEEAGGVAGYEFQRLHGMGEALYRRLRETHPGAACRVYAPVGGYRDLLAYLVRRLLENGARSSFVWQAADPDVPAEVLLRRPEHILARAGARPGLPAPRDITLPWRRGAAGVEFGARRERAALLAEVAAAQYARQVASRVDGASLAGVPHPVRSPIDGSVIGTADWADPAAAVAAVAAARRGAAAWASTPAQERAAWLERFADRLEGARGALIHVLQVEAGKTLEDALGEVREAADFCRYYAGEARRLMSAPQILPGPAGEDNQLRLLPRGVVLAISPWNFPLAIFVGQIAAALAAGNAVVAKPAEQTPLVAALAVRLMQEAGLPDPALQTALHLVLGDEAVGKSLVAAPGVDGVVFTGSTEAARAIHRALAAKDGPIVPLIAETGGVNAMIVDATALPEQVTDDVITSAFRSAGQRCSALRVLLLQAEVADRMLETILGAVSELALGDPRDPAVQVGPVIDAPARDRLLEEIGELRVRGRCLYEGVAPAVGTFVAPHLFDVPLEVALRREIFGPVLQVVRYPAGDLDRCLAALADCGWGLTLGVHSRIDATVARILARLPTGNVYVNRNMVGAVVGQQPFGGRGLSGTGPKAGGPFYIARFTTEQTICVNTAAAGGNVGLLAGTDEIGL